MHFPLSYLTGFNFKSESYLTAESFPALVALWPQKHLPGATGEESWDRENPVKSLWDLETSLSFPLFDGRSGREHSSFWGQGPFLIHFSGSVMAKNKSKAPFLTCFPESEESSM